MSGLGFAEPAANGGLFFAPERESANGRGVAAWSQTGGSCHIGRVESWEHCSDAELLLGARSSAEAFGVFYERHFASVLAFFRRRVCGPEEAFDLAAETFAAALASVPRFQPGPEPAQAWLYAAERAQPPADFVPVPHGGLCDSPSRVGQRRTRARRREGAAGRAQRPAHPRPPPDHLTRSRLSARAELSVRRPRDLLSGQDRRLRKHRWPVVPDRRALPDVRVPAPHSRQPRAHRHPSTAPERRRPVTTRRV